MPGWLLSLVRWASRRSELRTLSFSEDEENMLCFRGVVRKVGTEVLDGDLPKVLFGIAWDRRGKGRWRFHVDVVIVAGD